MSAVAATHDLTPHGTQPSETFVNGVFNLEAPGNCSACHEAGPPVDNEFIAFPTWAGSPMANAARDPIFWAALDVANSDLPGSGDFCLRCHTPGGWLAGRVRKTGDPENAEVKGEDGCLLLGEIDRPYTNSFANPNDFAGVHCSICHRMMPNGPNGETAPLGNGNLWIDAQQCDTPGFTGACRRGPYKALEQEDHPWQYSQPHTQSEICGSCHTVTSPAHNLIDQTGQDTGQRFPLERTYAEWRKSDFGNILFADSLEPETVSQPSATTCQNCHMPDSNHPQARASRFTPPGSRTGNLPTHFFLGPNSFLSLMLEQEYGGLGQLNRQEEFQMNAIAGRALLRQAATLDLSSGPLGAIPGELTATIRVTNLSGHKLPTGYGEGRRMWLHVEARDAADQLVFESGAYDSETAELTEDPQLVVYETAQGIWNTTTKNCDIADTQGRKLFHFALNNCVAKDNRIPPLGFSGGSDVEIMPVAKVYPEASPGVLVNFDDISYTIPVPAGSAAPITVTATLRYQSSSKDYIEFLKREADTNNFPNDCVGRSGVPSPTGVSYAQSRGAILQEMWTNYGKSSPENVTSASTLVVGP